MSDRLYIGGGEFLTGDGVRSTGVRNSYSFLTNPKHSKEERLLMKWNRYPLSFMEEALGFNKENDLELSHYQKEYFNLLGDLDFAKRLKWDNKNCLEKLNRAEKDISSKFGISVRSGKGIGKTTSLALTIIWFLFIHKNAKIPMIAPTEQQLKTVLMSEIHKWLNFRNENGEYIVSDFVREHIIADSEKIYFNDGTKSSGKNWYAFPRVAAKSTDENLTRAALSGLHEDSLLVAIEEAAGVAEPIYEALENTMTGRANYAVIVFNPSRVTGFACDTHRHPNISKQWVKLHWDAEAVADHIISKDHIDRLLEKYGSKDSNNYQVYVKGNFPKSDDGSLIPFVMIEDAIERNLKDDTKKVVMGVDVATNGGDQTIACIRQGPRVIDFIQISKIDTIDISIECARLARQYNVSQIFIDNIGVGSGVYDNLRRIFPETIGVCVSNRSPDDRFNRLRDYLWWQCRERFEKNMISIPRNNELIVQLSSISYEERTMNGKIKVEDKASMRKRLGESPDYADSMNLTFFYNEQTNDMLLKKKETIFDRMKREEFSGHTWMGV